MGVVWDVWVFNVVCVPESLVFIGGGSGVVTSLATLLVLFESNKALSTIVYNSNIVIYTIKEYYILTSILDYMIFVYLEFYINRSTIKTPVFERQVIMLP